MKVSNYKGKCVTLTEMEIKVYKILKQSETLEDAYCDSIKGISIDANIPMKEIRGVVSSLIKKGVVYIEELISGCGEWVVLFENK